MKKNLILIAVIVPIILVGIFSNLLFLNQPEKIKVVNEVDMEKPSSIENKSSEELTLEIQEKYDEITSQNFIYQPKDRTWPSSGPFSIDREEYILGEKIFLIADGINSLENGKIVFYRPLNQTHSQLWKFFEFDGGQKTAFNIYFEPKLNENLKICTKNDLIGEWIVAFENVNYPEIHFRIIDQILPGDEVKFNKIVC